MLAQNHTESRLLLELAFKFRMLSEKQVRGLLFAALVVGHGIWDLIPSFVCDNWQKVRSNEGWIAT